MPSCHYIVYGPKQTWFRLASKLITSGVEAAVVSVATALSSVGDSDMVGAGGRGAPDGTGGGISTSSIFPPLCTVLSMLCRVWSTENTTFRLKHCLIISDT